MDATDKAIAVVKLRDEFGKTQEEIGALVGLKERQMRNLVNLLAAPEDVRQAFREGKFALRHALALARVKDPSAREGFIRKAGVKRLRETEILGAAGEASGGPDGEPSRSVPEEIRSFVRVADTGDSEFPFRVTARVKTEEALNRLLKYLARLA